MSATATRHSTACAAARRHKHRRPRICLDSGKLGIMTPDVAARLLAEGVPAADIYVVAAEVERCIRFIDEDGDDVFYIRLHPWTIELIRRYPGKLVSLTMKTRGKVAR
jgi:hypothetical protein